jgi:hypothetical protein
LVVQLAQILSLNAGWRYVFLAGPKVTWLIASVGTGINVGGGGLFIVTNVPGDGTLNAVGLAADISVGIMPAPLEAASWTIGINLVAIYFARRLWCLKPTFRNSKVAAAAAPGAF